MLLKNYATKHRKRWQLLLVWLPLATSAGLGLLPTSVYAQDPAKTRHEINYDPFVQEMQKQIKAVWTPPMKKSVNGPKVVFTVNKAGKILSLRVTESVDPITDTAAVAAIKRAVLPPLPEGAPESIELEFVFSYDPHNAVTNKSSVGRTLADVLTEEGMKLLVQHEYAPGIQKLEKAVKAGSGRAKPILQAAYNEYALSLLDAPEECSKILHKAILLDPEDDRARTNLNQLVALIGKDPASFDDRVEIARKLRKINDRDGAIAEFKEALRIKKDPAVAQELAQVMRSSAVPASPGKTTPPGTTTTTATTPTTPVSTTPTEPTTPAPNQPPAQTASNVWLLPAGPKQQVRWLTGPNVNPAATQPPDAPVGTGGTAPAGWVPPAGHNPAVPNPTQASGTATGPQPGSTVIRPQPGGTVIRPQPGGTVTGPQPGGTTPTSAANPPALPVAIRTSPESRRAAINLNNDAVKAIASKDFQSAVSKLEEAIKLDPQYEHAQANLAIAYNNMGLATPNPLSSLPYFHKALYLSPSSEVTRSNLEASIHNALLDPASFDVRVKLAQECLSKNDLTGAIVEYREALRLKEDQQVRAKLDNLVYLMKDSQGR